MLSTFEVSKLFENFAEGESWNGFVRLHYAGDAAPHAAFSIEARSGFVYIPECESLDLAAGRLAHELGHIQSYCTSPPPPWFVTVTNAVYRTRMSTSIRVLLLDIYYALFWRLLLREERYADSYGAALLKKVGQPPHLLSVAHLANMQIPARTFLCFPLVRRMFLNHYGKVLQKNVKIYSSG